MLRTVKEVTDLPKVSPPQSSEIETQLAILASIIASSGDAILSRGIDGIINSWNPAAERIYGYSAEEIIGKSISMLIHPENVDEATHIIGKILDDQRIENYETVRVRKDGTEVPVSLTIAPMHDSTGAVIGASSITRDMTDWKRASRYARDVLESAPDAMIIADKTGTIVIVNAQTEKLFDYHRNEMIGQPVELLMPSRFRPKHPSQRDGFFADSKARSMGVGLELFGLRKDGREFPIEISLSPIETAEGILVAAAIRDVTDHKQMIRRLEEMNELRNEFVAVVAHDLRAPMMSISGFANQLIDQWNELEDDTKLQYLQIIVRNTDGLSEFVEDVLQVARMEAGEYNYDIQPLDIRSLTQNTMDDMTGATDNSRFTLITPNDLPLVLGDKDRQTQILTNLLSNAVKFSPAEEPILVRLSCINKSVQVAVVDRGVGIENEDLATLFQKSGRVFRAGDPKRPGNGLGLYICKTLVEAQGGRIWCESSPDHGSTFFYTIPVVP